MARQIDRFLVFTNKDEFVCEVNPSGFEAFTLTRSVSGEFSISFSTTETFEKGSRILLKADIDGSYKWYEFVVESVSEAADIAPIAVNSYYCIWSLQHDLELCTVSGMPGVQSPVTAAVALQTVLSTTSRWVAGSVDVTDSAGASMYEMSAWEALNVLAQNWECEFDAALTVGSTSISSRAVVLADAIGSPTATALYELQRNAARIVREVSEAPRFARIIPKGMGEETENGGYGRRIGIESVNDGIPYLQDDDVIDELKVPDGNGGWEYPICYVENAEIEDPTELKEWGLSVLESYSQPHISVTADITRLRSASGDSLNPLSLGDVVRIVDEGFHKDSALKVDARVIAMTLDLLSSANSTFTAGTELEGMSAALSHINTDLSAVSTRTNLAIAKADKAQEDSGWQNLTLESDFELYDSSSTASYRKVGRVVELNGTVKPTAQIAANASTMMAYLPDGYRPSKPIRAVCHGSSRAKWLLEIRAADNTTSPGGISVSRYEQGGTAQAITTSNWLPFQVTFLVD